MQKAKRIYRDAVKSKLFKKSLLQNAHPARQIGTIEVLLVITVVRY